MKLMNPNGPLSINFPSEVKEQLTVNSSSNLFRKRVRMPDKVSL